MRKRLFITSLTLAMTVLASCARNKDPKESVATSADNPGQAQSVQDIRKQEGFPVRVAAVRRETLTETVEATGEISEFKRVIVGVQEEAAVSAVHFEIGDEIEEGTLLTELDKTDLDAQIERAKAARDAAQTQLAKLKAGSRKEEIERARASLDGAIARLRVAEDDYNRAKELAAEGAIAAKNLDLATGLFHEGKARKREAEEQLKLAELGPRQEDIDAAEAQLREATAQIKVLEVRLAKHKAYSPITGVVTRKYLERGEFAKKGAALAEILDSRRVYADLDVPEMDIGKVRKGQKVSIRSDALPDHTFTDKIQTILPQATAESHLYRCRALLDNKKGLLKAGMFIRSVIEVGSIKDCLVIPEETLVNGGSVYRLTDNGTVELVIVKLGVNYKGRVQVLSGLEEGDRIAITNLASLRDDLKVQVAEE